MDKLQILRSLDKADRMEPDDVFNLLTKGRKDQSGDSTTGCNLGNSEAAYLTSFVFSVKHPRIMNRLLMIEKLESTELKDGCTAWDVLLNSYEKMEEPKNIAWLLDDLIKLGESRGRNQGKEEGTRSSTPLEFLQGLPKEHKSHDGRTLEWYSGVGPHTAFTINQEGK